MAATTATVTDIRNGIANQLGTIRGLRTSAYIPEDPKPPVAIVLAPNSISYDTAFGRGLDSYTFTVMVIVGRVSDRTAQASIDAFCSGSGALSIKNAIASDPTLNGACQNARVTEMTNYGSVTVGDVEYMSAEFSIQVYA